jgi:hypothetical protein
VTVVPEPPGRLLTVDAYAALDEDDRYRSELQEGNLVMSPSPTPHHMIAVGELFVQLRHALPQGLLVVPDVDVDLEFAPRVSLGSSADRTWSSYDNRPSIGYAVTGESCAQVTCRSSWRSSHPGHNALTT